ncbi:hypothetical protein [Rhodothermus marinus]|uniref:CRISPR-associated protein, putative n=1 Tax=Rhodothermus marinus (strain ATCC 43812 / DSM 4252 / R-10) TaxID=518766 RepID=D0MKN6_RHOM4|nr:hypothetical protein [Rhodothermus marinus]ACY49700.1 CRISPR-associated protein, putative [Rhodothermus marinus DSM 4252]AEN74755.1 CRISPR-associated protein, putative [Rhodothermus marinus SG0.5JP17-172]
MLINLSNHPASTWGKAQREASRMYGEVEDWPFPLIPPEWDAHQVAGLAQDYAERIVRRLNEAGGGRHAVHVMGEMTFTCTLVRLLHQRGILCLASTSQRIVEEDPASGKKIACFRFERFRPYPCLQALSF